MNMMEINKKYADDLAALTDNLLLEYKNLFLNHKKVLLKFRENIECEATIIGFRRSSTQLYNIEIAVVFDFDENTPTIYRPWQFDEVFIKFID